MFQLVGDKFDIETNYVLKDASKVVHMMEIMKEVPSVSQVNIYLILLLKILEY